MNLDCQTVSDVLLQLLNEVCRDVRYLDSDAICIVGNGMIDGILLIVEVIDADSKVILLKDIVLANRKVYLY